VNEISWEQIADNIEAVKEKIARAATRAEREPSEITLVAVSKTFPPECIEAAVEAGITDVGESRVQEGTSKIEKLGHIARWHLIGHLQTNKARLAVSQFDMIQSIDSVKLAEKVSREASRQEGAVECLVEVNSSGEESKFGFSPGDVMATAERIADMPGIRLRGLMTIGPWTTNEGCIKKAFDMTRGIYQRMQEALGAGIDVLSMGMSADYELAIECGSNMVRVGTAIFGERE
jgi:pyridoxal phosphate enzyme (YggS family)